MISLFGLDPLSWQPHPLHAAERHFTENNCYVDVLVELVAAAGGEPLAMLGNAVALDFEVDQWTFLKPEPRDLWDLYGIETREMQPYRPLPEMIAERLALGETLVPELDSYWLPDTAASSYRTEHVKSSVVAEGIDLDLQVFRYFHNATYAELSDEDYRAALRLDPALGPESLPPYVDLVRLHAARMRHGDELRLTAASIWQHWLQRRPSDNPVERFGHQLERQLPALLEQELAAYHDYAFATARMLGSGAELLASHVRWLFGRAGEPAAATLDEVVAGAKMLVFRMARRRPFDVTAVVDPLAERWASAQATMETLALPGTA